MSLDHTHDPDLISWVESARDHADFPVQNLPFGVMDFGEGCLLYTSPSPRDLSTSRMPSSA